MAGDRPRFGAASRARRACTRWDHVRALDVDVDERATEAFAGWLHWSCIATALPLHCSRIGPRALMRTVDVPGAGHITVI